MRVALKFAYDGKHCSGYARQPQQHTVEEALLHTLITNTLIRSAQDSCFRTASRTDRGVSALGNVCAFDTTLSPEEIIRRVMDETSAVFVYGATEVPSGFYPRYAKQRIYRYYLKRPGLNGEAVISTAALFTGEHNFSNFARIEPGKDPVRSIDNIVIAEKKDFFVIDFFAQTFLWNQIRRIVSALEKVGAGKLLYAQVKDALDHPEKKVDFQVAAPEPLLLKDVLYEFSFHYVKEYTKKVQQFENRIIASL
ncbi:MAG: tRNA pseudouridine(38-40) synthase TruA [Candidatus Thermoplasmatota archaeon]|nr:tRNA pseudouridine(38-40) synthase TruA [Candidatus Thermoplasmatota archaeon]